MPVSPTTPKAAFTPKEGMYSNAAQDPDKVCCKEGERKGGTVTVCVGGRMDTGGCFLVLVF